MDKKDYFPRKRIFQESQDLIATFYSTGEYISDNISNYSTILTNEGNKDEFFYCLYLLSMLSNSSKIIKAIERILRSMNTFRVKKKITSTEEFLGEIDIESYIQKNYIEENYPEQFPSVIKYSTFQVPEYQMSLFILNRCEKIFREIFNVLGENRNVTAFEIAKKHMKKMSSIKTLFKRKYGVSYDKRESYQGLKKKVVYRYKNRKILTNEYKTIMKLYEKTISVDSIDLNSDYSMELYDNYPEFDDRLLEIWLIRKSAELLSKKIGIEKEFIEYRPLNEAKKRKKYVVCIKSGEYRLEILFQNRKDFMPKKELKWYWDNDGKEEEIGAIPDLIFIKYLVKSDDIDKIVLVDAKNRNWTFKNDMSKIKSEIVQQIYIKDNFSNLFNQEYSSILVAHNIESYQNRKYNHKDNKKFEINVISLDMNEEEINQSLTNYVEELSNYLGV